ncbi:hypothetical protein VZT92_020191 [Zoarces viviparus]|uniref:Uncharacterized protein n=1 Tax=Zoarces viviparus TaxID=48416 RepID=A0AAW1EC79_ZOAVI
MSSRTKEPVDRQNSSSVCFWQTCREDQGPLSLTELVWSESLLWDGEDAGRRADVVEGVSQVGMGADLHLVGVG